MFQERPLHSEQGMSKGAPTAAFCNPLYTDRDPGTDQPGAPLGCGGSVKLASGSRPLLFLPLGLWPQPARLVFTPPGFSLIPLRYPPTAATQPLEELVQGMKVVIRGMTAPAPTKAAASLGPDAGQRYLE